MQAVVIRVTSATTLMYSHGRGARGAVAGLDIGRRVVTHVAQTGNTQRLPMLIPFIIHIRPYRPHPTDPCLCNPASMATSRMRREGAVNIVFTAISVAI